MNHLRGLILMLLTAIHQNVTTFRLNHDIIHTICSLKYRGALLFPIIGRLLNLAQYFSWCYTFNQLFVLLLLILLGLWLIENL